MHLRYLRQAKGYKQQELADKVGCGRTYLSLIENGHANPRLSMLTKISDALGVSIGDLFICPVVDEKGNVILTANPDALKVWDHAFADKVVQDVLAKMADMNTWQRRQVLLATEMFSRITAEEK